MPRQQTIMLEGSERIRINANCKNGKTTEDYFEDISVNSLYHLFIRGFTLAGNKPCLGHRSQPGAGPYTWHSYLEVKDMAEHVGSALLSLGGHVAGRGDKVGIYGANRWEWDVTQIGNSTYSLVTVPLYDTLGPEAISYIISITNMTTVVCDDEKKVKNLLKIRSQCPDLRLVITMNQISSELSSKLKEVEIQHFTFQRLLEHGKMNLKAPQPPTSADTLALILFTSGTTGRPKGVMLNHRQLVTDVGAIYNHVHGLMEITNDDCAISYLPQAHGFNQCATLMMLAHGGRIGYISGSVQNLMGDIKELKPTVFPIVPRLLNKIYDSVWQKASKNYIKRLLLKKAFETKKAQMEKGSIIRGDFYEKLVFKKIQKILGGRVRVMVTGSAPISNEVLTFIRAAVGCVVIEGYGQTETTAGSTCTNPLDYTPGHVGVPLTCVQMKLVDIPEMNYAAARDQGEVCVRGPHCFVGYWKDEENTRATLDSEGWVHTGDVGQWTESGTLRLIDRKKNIFKLAQGEYIAPEKIEGIYVQAACVAQVFVHGDSLETCCVAVVVPDEPVLRQAAADLGIASAATATWSTLCSDTRLRTHVLQQCHAKGAENGLNKLEQVKCVFLWDEVFSIDNDLLTPTLKSKRQQMRAKFATQIRDMYNELNSTQ